MARYSLEEAKARLPELWDLAVAGEEVLISAPGRHAVELRPIRAEDAPPQPLGSTQCLLLGAPDPAKLAWLDRIAVRPERPAAEHAGDLVRRLRDEEWR